MSTNQNDILNYRPDLNIYSNPSTNVILEEDNYTIGYVEEDENKSSVVREFEYQKPSLQLNDLSDLLDEIKDFKDKIELENSNNEYVNKYFNSVDDEESNNILKNNKEDLENGNTPLEVYTLLEDIEDEINSIINQYIICMFGKDTDIDTAKNLEDAYIDKINQLESNRDYEKINYFNLYYDCQISYLLREYITKLRYVCIELGYIKDVLKDTETNDLLLSMFKDKFKQLNIAQDNEFNSNIECCDDILTAMNNIFITKNKINNYFNIYSNLSLYGDCIEDIIEIKDDNIKDLESKLDNLIKTIMLSTMSKEDILKTLNKKSNYRSFFVS